MNRPAIVGLALVCFLAVGCQAQRPSEKEIDAELARAQKVLEPQLTQYLAFVEKFRDLGVAEVAVSPSGATLFVDGGEYLGDRASVTLPVGAHEFRAVWPDGAEASRNIYVEPGLGKVNLEYNYEQTSTGIKAHWKSGEPEVHKTGVRLVRTAE